MLVFAGATDGIAPVTAVKASCRCSPARREVRFEIVPGGHLGMLTGRAARGTTWRVLDEWIGQWSTTDERRAGREEGGARKTAKKTAKKTVAKKTAAKKPRRRKTAASKPTGSDRRVDADAIGVNPTRRYGSASLAQPGPLNRPTCALLRARGIRLDACRGRSGSATAPARWRPAPSGRCRD